MVLVHEHSRGIARTVNVICDNLLVTGFALERRPINCDIVREVVADLDLKLHDQRAADRSASNETVPPDQPTVAPDEARADDGGGDGKGEPRRFSFFQRM